MFRSLRDIFVDILEVSLSYFLEQIVLIFGSEGIISLQNDKEKYSQAP